MLRWTCTINITRKYLYPTVHSVIKVLFCWKTRRLVCEAMRETWRKRNMIMMMMMRTPARAESDDSRVSPFTRGKKKLQDLPEEPSSLNDIETLSASQPKRALLKQELVLFHSKVPSFMDLRWPDARTKHPELKPGTKQTRSHECAFR